MQIRAIAALTIGVAVLAMTTAQVAIAQAGGASKEQLRRGAYLVGYGGCNDCHTPKTMTPNGPVPDKARLLSGFPAAENLPAIPAGVLGPGQWGAITNNDLTAWAGPWGVTFAANLTPDATTGIGRWTAEQFIQTMRTGKHLGVGRPVLPPMPWFDVAVLTDADLKAVFAYLKSVPAIANQVPQPLPPK